MHSFSLVPELRQLLQDELAAGNQLAEISNWPPRCELLIVLKYRFRRRHQLPAGVEFAEINDPHYWQAEYRYGERQILAYRFE